MSDYIIKSKDKALATLPPVGLYNLFLDSMDGNFKKIDSNGVVSPVYFDGAGTYSEIAQNLADMQNPSAALANIGGEPAFTKNQAFNKDFGINAGEVVEGNDSRFGTLFANTTNNNNSIGVLSGNLATVTTEQSSQGTRITDLENITYNIDLNANEFRLFKNGIQIGSVDLSIYIDDTNLARLTNGVLDSNTGIATFERDDNSTFTVDFSSLIDGASLPVPTTGDKSKVAVVNNNSTAYELKSGLASFTALPPVGLNITIPPVDFGTGLGGRVQNSPIFYYILQNTLDFTNSVTNLHLIKNSVRTTVANYTANLGEIVIAIEDPNGDIALFVFDAKDKVNANQVLTNVPAGAIFTDTTYTDAEIKTKYESNPDTNSFTDSEKTKLSNQSGVNSGDQDISGISVNASNITDLQNDKADKSTLITAGSGLSGGGNLSSDKTIDVNTSKSITINSDNLELVSDEQNPTARKYYGTDNNGVKGWHNVRSSFINCSGRFYAYTNGRWVTDSDDNYGTNYYRFAEQGGTAATPIYEWEHLGTPLPQGTFIKALNFVSRANNAQTSDFEIIVVERKPTAAGGWQSGIDADGEMTNNVILNDTWQNLVGSFGGNMLDLHGANIPINHLINDFSMISIYIRPIEANTATRYILATWTWEIQ